MMKKVFALIVLTAICLSLFSGCGESAVGEAQTEETTTAVTTVPEGLTAEETAVWESMPEIVTMRVLNDLQEKTTEVLYIEKNGNVKKFMCDEYYKGKMNTEWIFEKINNSEAEVVDVIDIDQVIEFYNTFLLVDKESKITGKDLIPMGIEYEITFSYEIYGVRNSSQSQDVIIISFGQTGYEYYINDSYSQELISAYLTFDKSVPISS